MAINRNLSARFVVGSDATDTALREFFGSLPKKYQDKAITNIYIRVLRKVQADIRSSIRSNFTRGSGRLEKSVTVKYLKPRAGSKDPAAMVYMSNSKRHSDVFSVKTKRIVKGVSARYAYALEYGTPNRYRKKNRASTGRIPGESGQLKPYFRPNIDKWAGKAEAEILNELTKAGKKELERQATIMNRKTKNIKITV